METVQLPHQGQSSITVPVRFVPWEAGQKTATLRVQAVDGVDALPLVRVPLSGTAVSAASRPACQTRSTGPRLGLAGKT